MMMLMTMMMSMRMMICPNCIRARWSTLGQAVIIIDDGDGDDDDNKCKWAEGGPDNTAEVKNWDRAPDCWAPRNCLRLIMIVMMIVAIFIFIIVME